MYAVFDSYVFKCLNTLYVYCGSLSVIMSYDRFNNPINITKRPFRMYL